MEKSESKENADSVEVLSDVDEKFSENLIEKTSLDFTDGHKSVDDRVCPERYFTLTEKEKMLLIYTKFFRGKYLDSYPHRNRLILVVENECKVKKFVSTTICPTVFLYSELIDCWEGPAQLVADFITYEPLENQLEPVSEKNK